MSVLVLRHELFEHLGCFAQALDSAGVPYRYHELDDPTRRQLDPHLGLIVLGGPMSANDPIPGLIDEMRVIEQAISRGLPVLGVCLGAQLTARVLGARVYQNGQLEIGWAPVHFTNAGRQDPLFEGLNSPTTFFHWHSETFDLPAGAEWLAWSDLCRHQAYRYSSNVYGVQFHPEITAEMIVDWSEAPVNCGDMATLRDPLDPHAHDATSAGRSILERWLSLVAASV